MTTLHIINSLPMMRSCLQQCLSVIQKNDAIILIENAVIAAKKNNQNEELIKNNKNVFVLQADLKARAIKPDQIINNVELVDYSGFVKLTVKYNNTLTWS
ncbi:MAG: sulfurtransferase complex subunit TusB [Gammaproteobacteria bacterium]